MPYIRQEDRPQLDVYIDGLAAQLRLAAEGPVHPAQFSGLLNYCVTQLVLKAFPTRKYWKIALVTGVLHNVANEFYRRYAAPYEDEQIAKNGDVY